MKISILVPATSANLGPGFDCFGLALKLYNTLEVETDRPFSISLGGSYVDGIPTDKSNLIWQTMLKFWQITGFPAPEVALTQENHIPPARGLGSSSAAIVAGILGANAFLPVPLVKSELLQIANEIEGHPDNVTPALYGGVTLSVPGKNGVLPKILPVTSDLRAVVVIPDLLLKTEEARHLLPPHISREEAVFNIAHASLLIYAFMSGNYSLLQEGMEDQLHQERRSVLIPGMKVALQAALDEGAYGSALSGSGPTLIALCPPGPEEKIAGGMLKAIEAHGIKGKSHILDLDIEGAKISIQ